MHAAVPPTAPLPRGDLPRKRPKDGPTEEFLPVMLYEDGEGRLVVIDARTPQRAPAPDAPLLRIGRARLARHHLAPPVLERLLEAGHAVVDGADALNVLLAFSSCLGPARGDRY